MRPEEIIVEAIRRYEELESGMVKPLAAFARMGVDQGSGRVLRMHEFSPDPNAIRLRRYDF